MEAVKSVRDFKKFIKLNREQIYANVENSSDISVNDEWMQEDEWDEIYKREEVHNGRV